MHTNLIRSVLLAASILAMPGLALADAFDDQVSALGRAKASFGHDIDAEGKVADFVKDGLDAFKIPHAGAQRLKKILAYGWDYKEAARKGQAAGKDPQLADFNRFFIKSMLNSVSPKEYARVQKMLGDSPAAAKILKNAGINVTEAVSGTLPAGAAREVIEAAAVAAIDQLCPACAVARTGAVLAITEGQKLRAVFEDDRTRALYEAWKQGDGQLPQGLRGGDAAFVAARRAIEEARAAAGQPGAVSDAEIEKAVLARFESWRRGEAVGTARAAILAKARPDYDRLDPAQRRLFGTDEAAQAAGFARGFLDAFDALKEAMGDRPAPPNMIQEAVFLALTRADPTLTMADWRSRLRQIARAHGWPDPYPLDPTGVRERVSRRLKQLNHHKMEAVFDAIGVDGTVRKNWYGCLCSQVPHGVGVGFIYAPANGKPCLSVGGFGTWSEPFPTLETAYDACFEAVRVAPASGVAPVPFDDYLAGRLTGTAR